MNMNLIFKIFVSSFVMIMLLKATQGYSFSNRLGHELSENMRNSIDEETDSNHLIFKRSARHRRIGLVNTIYSICGKVMEVKCSLIREKCHWLTKRSTDDFYKKRSKGGRIKRGRRKSRRGKNRRGRKRHHLNIPVHCNTCRNLCW
ncbi:uncharacterized protein LOC120332729 [Styela clava]